MRAKLRSVRERAIVSGILLVEVVVVDILYWARGTTFISDPERFRIFEPALKSDAIVFLLVPALAALAVGWVLSHRSRSRTIVTYVTGVILSAFAFGVAMLLALNAWGS